MIVEYIRYRIPEGEADAFEDAYRRAAGSLDASAHCERYEVARCAEDPGAYTVRIEWDSAEGHLHGTGSRRVTAGSSRTQGEAGADRASTDARRSSNAAATSSSDARGRA